MEKEIIYKNISIIENQITYFEKKKSFTFNHKKKIELEQRIKKLLSTKIYLCKRLEEDI